MSTRTVYTCDRCGNDFENDSESWRPAMVFQISEKKRYHDLCKQCAKEFKVWMGWEKADEQ